VGCVQGEGEEADGDVQDFAGDFVFVDLGGFGLVSAFFCHGRLVVGECERTKDRHFWWIGIRPRGLGLRLISRQ
jgi:hypothetical protein